MSIKQRVIHQLEQLAAKGPQPLEAVVQKAPEPGTLVGLLAAEGTGLGASLNLADYDRYSVALKYLEVFNNSLTVDNNQVEASLTQAAAEISQRLTYLAESLALLEMSTTDKMAQLRSHPPEQGPNESKYWEVTIRMTPHPQAKIARYHWTPGNRERVNIPYPITFATLGRITEDLADSLATIEEVA